VQADSAVRAAVPAEFCVISVGGVDDALDVQERLDAGATLVQGYTAFLYRGPLWAAAINKGLARILDAR
jgi:dihydroorotate dehydrogenase